ncbi:MAG TPA: NADH-quinone oxidoreductase subunit A [Gemmataceae bacterium]|jgi:NADH-quinone oxidoreductase subunit A
MPEMLAYLLLFTGVGAAFIFVNLMVGKLIRPAKMDAEKATIYECGEPTIGSAWVQFDLRFYVVALLFVIFDVEMAFFFPWAVVFGQANELADPNLSVARRAEAVAVLQQAEMGRRATADDIRARYESRPELVASSAATAAGLARMAFVDILFFFGVLLVGFAYLWRRGDLDWVRSTAAQKALARAGINGEPRPREQLVVLTKD